MQECVMLNLKFLFCKKRFQFAVPWPLLPGNSCVAVFLGTQPSKRQEHKENVKLKFAAIIAPVLVLLLLLRSCVTKGKYELRWVSD